MNTKFGNRKLAYYIDKNIINPIDEVLAVKNLAGYITANDIDNAKKLADNLISSELVFSRNTKVPSIITYSKGETPAIKLELAYWLEKLYTLSSIDTYHDHATEIVSRLNSNMAYGSNTAGLSSFVLLYDDLNNLIQTFRSGAYTSDMIPAAWFLMNYENNADEIINFIKEAQETYKLNAGSVGPFMPYYNISMLENNNYGELNAWLFNGPNGDELDFYHQYKTALNLAMYYYEVFKNNGEVDEIIQEVLDNFLTYIKNRDDVPTTQAREPLYATNEEISATNDIISATQEEIISVTQEYYNPYYAALIGLIATYKHLVDRDEISFNIAKNHVEKILETQKADGSIDLDTNHKQLTVWQLLSLYNSINDKSYYDIINDALMLLRLDPIGDKTKDTHPQKSVLNICQNGIDFILLKRYFNHTLTQTILPADYKFNLNELGITHNRIESISYFKDNEVMNIREISFMKFIEYINKTYQLNFDPNSIFPYSLPFVLEDIKEEDFDSAAPLKFAVNNDILYLCKRPDKDYKVVISHYKLEENLVDKFNKIPKLLPQKWYHVLKWYITWKMSILREDGLASFAETVFQKHMSQMSTCDAQNTLVPGRLPSGIRWQ